MGQPYLAMVECLGVIAILWAQSEGERLSALKRSACDDSVKPSSQYDARAPVVPVSVGQQEQSNIPALCLCCMSVLHN